MPPLPPSSPVASAQLMALNIVRALLPDAIAGRRSGVPQDPLTRAALSVAASWAEDADDGDLLRTATALGAQCVACGYLALSEPARPDFEQWLARRREAMEQARQTYELAATQIVTAMCGEIYGQEPAADGLGGCGPPAVAQVLQQCADAYELLMSLGAFAAQMLSHATGGDLDRAQAALVALSQRLVARPSMN